MDPERIQKRLRTRYIDRMTHDYDEAIRWALDASPKRTVLVEQKLDRSGPLIVDGAGGLDCGLAHFLPQ